MFSSNLIRWRHTRGQARGHFDPSRPLVFTHIPKTSGIALGNALAKALNPNRVVGGHDTSLFGDFTNFDTMSNNKRKSIFHPADALPRPTDLVLAHMAHSTTAAAYPDAQHFTVVREPLIRLLSHYLFWRGLPETEIAAWGCWGDRLRLARAPLAEFLSDERVACQTDNLTLRMLLWPHYAIPPGGFISAEDDRSLLSAAKIKLSKYSYVDAIERPNFRSALCEWFGRQIEYVPQNVTAAMPADLRTGFASLLTPQAISLLRVRTRLDEALWRAIIGNDVDVEALRLGTLLPTIARYGAMMSA